MRPNERNADTTPIADPITTARPKHTIFANTDAEDFLVAVTSFNFITDGPLGPAPIDDDDWEIC